MCLTIDTRVHFITTGKYYIGIKAFRFDITNRRLLSLYFMEPYEYEKLEDGLYFRAPQKMQSVIWRIRIKDSNYYEEIETKYPLGYHISGLNNREAFNHNLLVIHRNKHYFYLPVLFKKDDIQMCDDKSAVVSSFFLTFKPSIFKNWGILNDKSVRKYAKLITKINNLKDENEEVSIYSKNRKCKSNS